MKKKLTALLAAFLMMVSILPASAFAAFNDFNKRSTKIDGECNIPDIKIEVTVPTGMTAVMNPSKAPVEINGQVTRRQILTDTAYIENKSEAPVSVSAEISCKINEGSNLELTKESTAGSDLTSKSAFIYFEMHAVNSATKKAWDSEYDPETHILVSADETNAKENFVVIGAASQKNHFGTFRLTGDCVAKPEGDPWTEDDGFTAKIVFTFEALPYTTD